MGKMAELYVEAQRLVVDAMNDPGVMSELDVLDYVNERLPIYVDLEFVESVMDNFFGDDWAGGCDIPSYD